jgi:hypothetical protein
MSTHRNTSPQLVNLAPDDVQKLIRPHKGWDAFASRIASFYRANIAALRIDGIDLNGMLDHVRIYQALAEPEFEAMEKLRQIQATRVFHAAEAWRTILEIYARAVTVGRVNAAVKSGIAAFAAFMKRGPNKKKDAPAAPVNS